LLNGLTVAPLSFRQRRLDDLITSIKANLKPTKDNFLGVGGFALLGSLKMQCANPQARTAKKVEGGQY
jgi:hypothetical protein